MGRVVYEARATCRHAAREEGESDAPAVGDCLESSDQVGPFEILDRRSQRGEVQRY